MKYFIVLWSICSIPFLNAQIPVHVRTLMKHYPQIVKYENNHLYFANGNSVLYDDRKKKSSQELLQNPDIEDQFTYAYVKGTIKKPIARNYDPGRIRHETMFKHIYGRTKEEVLRNVTTVVWCPTIAQQFLQVTTINNVHKQVENISKELDQHPEWKEYIKNIGGTFDWRTIAGTNRLSFHSFGMTIDINTKHSHYWQWDCKCKDENILLRYRNQIPQGIIDIFEKYGFIWGGKWYHYDTMHFEYRPELVFG